MTDSQWRNEHILRLSNLMVNTAGFSYAVLMWAATSAPQGFLMASVLLVLFVAAIARSRQIASSMVDWKIAQMKAAGQEWRSDWSPLGVLLDYVRQVSGLGKGSGD